MPWLLYLLTEFTQQLCAGFDLLLALYLCLLLFLQVPASTKQISEYSVHDDKLYIRKTVEGLKSFALRYEFCFTEAIYGYAQ